MYLSLCRVTAGSKLDWPDFVALAGRVGFDAVDIDMEPLRRDGAPATLELLTRYNVKPGVCPMPVEFRTDDRTFQAAMRQLPFDARLAVALDCPRMATWVPPVFDRPGAEMRAVLQNRFREIAKVLADHNVRMGLEFISPLHFRENQGDRVCIWQMADMLDLCHACGDNVGLLLDCWHWHHDPDHSVQAILDAGKDRIVTVHLNDAPDLPPDEIRDDERLLPGEGVIDLKGFVEALRQIGYADAVSLEVFGRLKGLDNDEAARLALESARAVLADS